MDRSTYLMGLAAHYQNNALATAMMAQAVMSTTEDKQAAADILIDNLGESISLSRMYLDEIGRSEMHAKDCHPTHDVAGKLPPLQRMDAEGKMINRDIMTVYFGDFHQVIQTALYDAGIHTVKEFTALSQEAVKQIRGLAIHARTRMNAVKTTLVKT